ncbi:MAG: response regulator [Motiliproteus sp.]
MSNKTILVIDDSASIRQVVGMTLKGAGYDVIEAGNGKEGLDKLNGVKINLIITDINMPVMDGISFIKQAKQLPRYKFTPIMVLSTESQDGKKQEGQAAGAKAWIVKPFQPPQLLAAVAKLVLP